MNTGIGKGRARRHWKVLGSLVAALLLTACRPDPDPVVVCAAPAERPDGIIMAGSGANLPLFRALVMLAGEDVRRAHGEEFVVPDSIGTNGAIRALADGAIDLGLASRPLRASELALGIREVPVARSVLVIAGHRALEGQTLSWEALLKLAAGGPFDWPDGTPGFVVHREESDSGVGLLHSETPALAAALDAGRAAGGMTVYTDADAMQVVHDTPGAVALLDLAAAQASTGPVAAIAITGAPADTQLSWRRDLSLLVPPQSEAVAATFIESLRTPQAVMALQTSGYEILLDGTP